MDSARCISLVKDKKSGQSFERPLLLLSKDTTNIVARAISAACYMKVDGMERVAQHQKRLTELD